MISNKASHEAVSTGGLLYTNVCFAKGTFLSQIRRSSSPTSSAPNANRSLDFFACKATLHIREGGGREKSHSRGGCWGM